jgi:hypothetical protein
MTEPGADRVDPSGVVAHHNGTRSGAVSDVVQRTGRRAGREATEHKDTLGRVGLAGKGVLYGVIGLLALQLAIGSPDEEASPQGALQWIGDQPLGKFLLVALTASLFALAAWRLLDAWRGDPVEGNETKDRARFAVQGVVYLGLAVGALSATIANWGGSSGGAGGESGSSQQQATGVILDWPGGRWLVAAAGVALIAYALYVAKHHAVDAAFMERLSTTSDTVERFGRAGYAARSVVWAVVGVLLIQAAASYDPGQAGGLSTALRELASSGWGRWLLVGVAAGLFSFGAFCIAEARYRRAA